MPVKKSYADHGDACATAHGIEVIGDVWTYPVLREMFLGPKRFTELAALLHGITPAVLTSRLRDLEAKGLVRRVTFPPPTLGQGYELTEWGHALQKPLEGIARWAQSSPTWRNDGGLTPDGAVLAMTSMAGNITTSANPDITLALRLTDSRCARPETYTYTLTLTRNDLTAKRGEPTGPVDATVTCDSTTWAGALFSRLPLEPGAINGEPSAVDTFLTQFRTAQTR